MKKNKTKNICLKSTEKQKLVQVKMKKKFKDFNEMIKWFGFAEGLWIACRTEKVKSIIIYLDLIRLIQCEKSFILFENLYINTHLVGNWINTFNRTTVFSLPVSYSPSISVHFSLCLSVCLCTMFYQAILTLHSFQHFVAQSDSCSFTNPYFSRFSCPANVKFFKPTSLIISPPNFILAISSSPLS